jgi:predicted component of viral defense system (DUF524 family)
VSSIDAISSSASIVKELTKKSLSILLLLTETLYQYIKNETKIPNNAIFQNKSKTTKGIKIIFSLLVSISTKKRIFDIYGKIKSIIALL